MVARRNIFVNNLNIDYKSFLTIVFAGVMIPILAEYVFPYIYTSIDAVSQVGEYHP